MFFQENGIRKYQNEKEQLLQAVLFQSIKSFYFNPSSCSLRKRPVLGRFAPYVCRFPCLS